MVGNHKSFSYEYLQRLCEAKPLEVFDEIGTVATEER